MTKNHDQILNNKHEPNASLTFLKTVGWKISDPAIL